MGDVVDDAATGLEGIRHLPFFGNRSLVVLRQRLAVLDGCIDPGGGVDWLAFSARCGLSALETDEDKDDASAGAAVLTPADLARSVDDLHLGVRAARLTSGGYATLGDLVAERGAGFAGLGDLPAFGAGSIALVAQRLAALEACVDDDGGLDWLTFDRLWKGLPEGGPEPGSVTVQLSETERSRSIEVLGLGAKGERLARGGFEILGSLVDDAACGYPGIRRLPVLGVKLLARLRDRIAALGASTREDGSVDWADFARRCDLEPILSDDSGTVQPTPPLAGNDRARGIECLRLGVRARRLLGGGFLTVGQLADDRLNGFPGISGLPGFGDGAVALVRRRLAALETCRSGDGPVDWNAFACLLGEGQAAAVVRPAGPDDRLSDAARARPIEVLRPGPKAAIIRASGLRTLADLMTPEGERTLPRLTGLGHKTTGQMRQRLADLCASIDADGEPDWDGVAAGWGLVVTPRGPTPDGETFVAGLGEVISTVVACQRDEMDRMILSERLTRSREDRMTLEAIGEATGVTRERIRQREKRLLDGLADALINDDQFDVPVHFREDFRAFWVRAAERFASIDELTFGDFVAGLEASWGVPATRLAPFLPLATSILADGVRLTRPRVALNPRLLKPVSPAVLTSPLKRFPSGRAYDGLMAAGCTSFGALLIAGFEDRLPVGRDGRVAVDILNTVAAALTEGGEIDPANLASGLGMPLLPEAEIAEGRAFLEGLDAVLCAAAGHNATSARAAAIYRMRTSASRRVRPTLDEVAAAFGSHGPSVKREETTMLAALNAQLVERDFTDARVVWRPSFLQVFRKATEVCAGSAGDYDRFCRRLASDWNLVPETVRDLAEGLWAVLTLYPGGRRPRVLVPRPKPAPVTEAEVGASPAVITLRGFRRQH